MRVAHDAPGRRAYGSSRQQRRGGLRRRPQRVVELDRAVNNNSSAPAIERDVLQQHSYGRQIGRLMDALSVLVERLPASAKDDQRIEDFVALAKEVAQIKENARLPRLERLRKDIEALRQEDPKAYAQLKALLVR
jgi:hypothetical protein